MTWPRPRATMPGSTARVAYIRPLQLVSTIWSQASTVARCAGSRPLARPALLTSTSMSANAGGRLVIANSTASRSRTSSSTASARSPSSWARAAIRSPRRAEITTRAPSAANRRAIEVPNPELAPVTSTVRAAVTADLPGRARGGPGMRRAGAGARLRGGLGASSRRCSGKWKALSAGRAQQSRADRAAPGNPWYIATMPNRLAAESSPYLRQHADNPVDWWPWGEAAFAEARRLDRPVFVSIGYAACHWCHVMAHESFEDEATARVMNDRFINIKVDREERPDVDAIFMNAIQVQGEGGGWPLSAFCLPDGRPYFLGTYFPREPRFGRPGFHDILEALANAYRSHRSDAEDNALAL